MAKYLKRPVVVEAWSVSELCIAAQFAWNELPKTVVDAYDNGDVLFLGSPPRIQIKTLEGWMTGEVGDMLIRGVEGELYPCKRSIFKATYEAVDA